MAKDKIKKITAAAARIFGYVTAIGISVLFALYLNAPAGWTLFYVLAAAPVFSLLVTFITYKCGFVSVSADISGNMVYKGESVKLKITAENSSILPVPALIVRLRPCSGFTADGKGMYVVSISPRSTTVLEVDFKAKMWGREFLGADSVTLCDFLKIAEFPVYVERGLNTYACEVRVFPNIPDIPSDTPLVKSAAESIRFSDDSEDTKESDKNNLSGGMPGYTHREYVEGDPIRRINWKLSSKRDVYMVRLDDEIEAMQQVIVLDSVGGEHYLDERIVEGMLAVVFSLFRLGFESTVWINTKNGFVSRDISDYGDVTALQSALADYDFIHGRRNVMRIPLDELQSKKQSGGIMLFTSAGDKELAAEIESVRGGGTAVTTAAVGETMVLPSPCWLIAEDYTAEQVL